MSAFNSPEDVVAWAEKCVVDDHERHLKFGNDLNPYCTPGARNDWQRGFDNAPPYSWELPARAYDTMFQRGRAMARLLEREQEGPASSASPSSASRPPTQEPSDSVWDGLKELRAASKLRRAEHREHAPLALARRGFYFEVKNEGAHLIVDAALGKIDYWPGTGLWICRYGPRGRGLQPLLQHLNKY